MKRSNSFYFYIIIFLLAQIAWLALLGLWIYWYVSNYIILKQVGDQLSPQIKIDNPNVLVFVGGIILMVAIAFGMSIIFRNLSVQLKLTNLYDNFIANVTHELKSPLTSIQLYLETLHSRDVTSSNQKKFLGLMIKDACRLNNLINSILEISKLEQKKIAHNFQIYNADSIVRTIVEEAYEQFNLADGIIKIEGSANCQCVVDPGALKIVFNNIIDNAIKYSLDTPQININLRCLVRKLLLEFTDKGIGINSNEQKKIFKKFHRIYSKNIPSVKGTGLGLYWVKEIIKSHGGKISAFSEGLNKGTTIKIELPIYQASKKYFINKLLKLTKKSKKLLEAMNE